MKSGWGLGRGNKLRPPTGYNHPTVRGAVTSMDLFLYEQMEAVSSRAVRDLPFRFSIVSIHVLPVDVCSYRARRCSSGVERQFCKLRVGGSNPSTGFGSSQN
jgi:hypothetical protein